MSMSKIERAPQSYEDFAYRFQLAQGLPQDDRGIIFVGNTRAGKSTLALSMSGAAMKVIYNSGNLTYVNPTDKQFEYIVKNTLESVTEKPNFYKKSNHNKCAIVDMPGYADSSRFRELINFHYIRTMASNLKEVRFLLVVTLQYKNDKFVLPSHEFDMLESFRKTFPTCSDYVTIIINRIEDLQHNEYNARKGFRDSIATCQNADLKKFYHTITDNRICVIERPEYRKSVNGESKYEEPYINMNLKTREIMQNHQAKFIKLKESDYDTLNIFKEGDNAKNKAFLDKMDQLMLGIVQRIGHASKVFKEIIVELTKSVVVEKSSEFQLISIIDLFLAKYNIQTPDKKKITIDKSKNHLILGKSKILELLHLITQQEYKFQNLEKSKQVNRQSMRRREEYWKKVVNDLLKKLYEVIDSLYHNEELNKRITELFLFFNRRVTESSFLSHVIIDQTILDQEKRSGYPREFNALIDDLYLNDEKFIQYFSEIVKYFMNISVPKIFSEHKNHFAQLEKELVSDFDILLNISELPDRQNYETIIKPAIVKRKDETVNFFILKSDPKTNEEISSHVEKLLLLNQNTSIEMRLEAVHKLGKLLERQKDYKTTVILYLYLHLSEEMMRVLALLEPTLKKDEATEWLSEIANVLTENGKFAYAERCLQSAKKHATDQIGKYIDLQQRCLRLNDPSFTSAIIAKRTQLKTKESLWNWGAISEQIALLIKKLNVKAPSNITKSLLLSKYR